VIRQAAPLNCAPAAKSAIVDRLAVAVAKCIRELRTAISAEPENDFNVAVAAGHNAGT